MILILMLIRLLIGLLMQTVRRLLWKWWMLDKAIHCCNGLIQLFDMKEYSHSESEMMYNGNEMN